MNKMISENEIKSLPVKILVTTQSLEYRDLIV